MKQVEFFEASGKPLEAKRLKERTEFDLEMIRELGYCSGIENYSRYLDGREPGTRPFCLIDYFPDDFLMVIVSCVWCFRLKSVCFLSFLGIDKKGLCVILGKKCATFCATFYQ